MIKSSVGSPAISSPPKNPRTIIFPVRHSAQRPLPALFAILFLIGVMVIGSLLLKDSDAQERQRVGLTDQPASDVAPE